MSSVKDYFRDLNLFEVSPDLNEDEARQQLRINTTATRVYLIVLILSLLSLGIHSWLSSEIIIVEVKHPTSKQLSSLPDHAECPCSNIAVSYGEFTSFQSIFHQVCSSDFVSDRWINALFSGANATYLNAQDFRIYGAAQFQALEVFCRLSKANAQQNINSFQQNIFVSPHALLKAELEAQVQSSIDQFKATAPQAFSNQLELIHRTTFSNKLVSGLQTNNFVTFTNHTVVKGPATIHMTTYEQSNGITCDCFSDLQCTSDAVFDDKFEASTLHVHGNRTKVSGISSGCLPVSSMLASTLTCFYDQTCLDTLLSFFPITERFSAMVVDNKSRFSPTATIQSMVENLMIEEWNINISYENYYDQCAPAFCTYLKEERHGFLFALTRLIGVLSGLTVLLELIIPSTVQLVLKRNTSKPSLNISGRLLMS